MAQGVEDRDQLLLLVGQVAVKFGCDPFDFGEHQQGICAVSGDDLLQVAEQGRDLLVFGTLQDGGLRVVGEDAVLECAPGLPSGTV